MVAVKEKTSIWDDDKIEKFYCDKDNNKKWKCLWCGKVAVKWNATVAVAHMAKRTGQDISTCRAKHDQAHADFYQSLQGKTDKKRKNTSTIKEQSTLAVEALQNATVAAILVSEHAKQNKK